MSTQNIYSFGEKADSQDRKRPLSTITETNNESNSTSRPQEISKDTPKKDTEKGTNYSAKRKASYSSSDSSDDTELDMFADDEEYERQLTKLKESKKIESVVQVGEKMDNKTLSENWDDEEGYYKFNASELFNEKYQIINENGKGVFSSVICCTDLETQEKVAIKVVRNLDRMREEGQKEIKILEELKKKKVPYNTQCISLLHHFTYRQHLCLVFPYMAMNLRDVLNKYGANIGLSFQAVQTFARKLFISLHHTRSLGLIHADLKPDNILIKQVPGNDIYLSDFGSAIHENDPDAVLTPYLVSRFYRAPEVILGLKPTTAIDIWAAGCVLIELYIGTPIFQGRSNNEMIKYFLDYKGPFSHRMVRKHIATYENTLRKEPFFNENYEFLLYNEDPVTKNIVIKPILYTEPKKSIEQLVLQHTHSNDNKNEVKQFVDFLEKCFILDPEKRLTPEKAFEHPYLKSK